MAITPCDPCGCIPGYTSNDTFKQNLQVILCGLLSSAAPLGGYVLTDQAAGATAYYGYLAADGSWYILQSTATANRYAKGTSGYAAAWTGRAGLTYGYFDAVFGA